MPVVVLTREAPRNDELRDALAAVANVFEVPLTTTHYAALSDVEAQIAASASGQRYGTLALTSARCARFVDAALAHCAPDAVVAVVGDVTRASLPVRLEPGINVVVAPERTAQSLAHVIERGPVLALGARGARPELAEVLARRGIEITRVACYETVPSVLGIEDRETLADADVVVIMAPSAWEVARDLVAREALIVVTGPTTAAAVTREHDPSLVVTAVGDVASAVASALGGAGSEKGTLT